MYFVSSFECFRLVFELILSEDEGFILAATGAIGKKTYIYILHGVTFIIDPFAINSGLMMFILRIASNIHIHAVNDKLIKCTVINMMVSFFMYFIVTIIIKTKIIR